MTRKSDTDTEGDERKLMLAFLRYGDTFVKVGDAWLFAERNLYRLDRDAHVASLAFPAVPTDAGAQPPIVLSSSANSSVKCRSAAASS